MTIQSVVRALQVDEQDILQLLDDGLPRALDRALESDEASRIARFFGVELEALFSQQAHPPALALLMRSRSDRSSLMAAVDLRDQLFLGDFVRYARRYHLLAERLGQVMDGFEALRASVPTIRADRPYEEGRLLAAHVRQQLALGVEPIDSMRALLSRCGVSVWVTDVAREQLSAAIEGASAYEGSPAILVNLIYGDADWWHTRMTLAHELCHLLIDADSLDGTRRDAMVMISPKAAREERGRSSVRRARPEDERFLWLEARANAFAAYFLAPPEGVRACVDEEPGTAEQLARRLMQRFGVGFIAAVNVLENLHHITLAQARALREAPSLHQQVIPHGEQDRFSNDEIGLERGPLLALIKEALGRGLIQRAAARRLLDLELTDTIPGLDDLPLITEDELARRRAFMLLTSELDVPMLHIARLERLQDHYEALAVTPEGAEMTYALSLDLRQLLRQLG